ncbi:DUF4177 domain-containing protein [Candidatus Amarolinea aalborgensis]|uniref:DUF4177 domain-containing protein n=1 Tax=Candidatus Amarolinea aalborgensis TaxID=2249329 RepID=UPI003BF96579
MTERKQTPDLLGELLGGGAPEPDFGELSRAASAAPPVRDASAPRPVSKPAARPAAAPVSERQPAAKAPPARVHWQYLVVSFQEYKGWRPRFRNGEKIVNWEDQPLLHDYLNQLGAEGWEMSGASAGRALYGSRDEYQVIFKRPSSPAS